MADPFSIASGAVGVVSLGIQVAQGLYNYVSAVQGADAAIERVMSSTITLQRVLKEVDPILRHSLVSESDQQMLADTVVTCKDNFGRIDAILKPFVGKVAPKDRGNASATTPNKVKFKTSLRKLIWPMKATETDALIGYLDQCTNRLTLALNATQSKTTLKSLQLNEANTKSLADTTDIVVDIRSHTSEMKRTLSSNSMTMQEIKDSTSINTAKLETKLGELETQQRQLIELFLQTVGEGRMGLPNTESITKAIDPLARNIMEQTVENATKKHMPKDQHKVSGTYVESVSSKSKAKITNQRQDYEWNTPFGRLSISSNQQEEIRDSKFATNKITQTSTRYACSFVPAPWLFNRAAAIAFMHKVDGFGLQFSTPAVLKADEPALRYLRRGDFEQLRSHVAENPFLLNAVNDNTSRTLLAEAVRCRRVDAVEYLLELGSDPEVEDRWGATLYNTLFHDTIRAWGKENRTIRVYRRLQSTRADLYRGNKSVMHCAVMTNYVNTPPFVIRAILKTIHRSMDGLTDVDEVDAKGNSALIAACNYSLDNDTAVEFLLSIGANPNMTTSSRSVSPVYAAARAGNMNCLISLLEHGATFDPNMRDEHGRTALHNAVLTAVRVKTRGKGALVPSSTDHSTYHKKWQTNFELLINHGVDINAQDNRKRNVLHYAVTNTYCDQEMLRFLVTMGADNSMVDEDGKTPLILAKDTKKYSQNAYRYARALNHPELEFISSELKKERHDKKECELPDDDEWEFLISGKGDYNKRFRSKYNQDNTDTYDEQEVDSGIRFRGMYPERPPPPYKEREEDDDEYNGEATLLKNDDEEERWLGSGILGTIGSVLSGLV